MKKYVPQLSDDGTLIDALDREKCISGLTRVFSQIDSPFVLSINGRWGTGKTFFVKKWQEHLANQNPIYPSIYFNAWDHDVAEEPLVPLIAEIDTQLGAFRKNDSTNLGKAWIDAKAKGVSLLTKFSPLLIRLATQGIIDSETGRGMFGNKEATKDLPSITQTLAKETIDHYQSSRKEIGAFKERLEEFVKEFDETSDEYTTPLFFFIDELDRCRPPFAVSLLEKVKHIFSVQRIVFVVSVDQEQLAHSIRTMYGQQLDAEAYLSRFFDHRWDLPQVSPQNYSQLLSRAYRLQELMAESQFEPHAARHLLAALDGSFEGMSMSLRDQEQIVSHLELILSINKRYVSYVYILVAVLLCLRKAAPDFYKVYRDRTISIDEVVTRLGLRRATDHESKNVAEIVHALLYLASGNAPDAAESDEAQNSTFAVNKEVKENSMLDYYRKQIDWNFHGLEVFRQFVFDLADLLKVEEDIKKNAERDRQG